MQVSNNGTSFEVTKRKLSQKESYIGIDIFIILSTIRSCLSVFYQVMKLDSLKEV